MITAQQFKANKKAFVKAIEDKVIGAVINASEVSLLSLSTDIHIELNANGVTISDMRVNMPIVNERLKVFGWRLEENRDSTNFSLVNDPEPTFHGMLIELEQSV